MSTNAPQSAPSSQTTKSVWTGFVIGLLLGYPVSYFFQPGALRAKMSLADYIKHISDIFNSKNLAQNAFLGMVITIVVCMALGYFVGKAKARSN